MFIVINMDLRMRLHAFVYVLGLVPSLLQSCTGFLWALSRGPQGQVCGCLWFISAEITQAVPPYPSPPLHCALGMKG